MSSKQNGSKKILIYIALGVVGFIAVFVLVIGKMVNEKMTEIKTAQQVSMQRGENDKVAIGTHLTKVNQIKAGLELYLADNQKYPSTLSELVPKYLTQEIILNPYTKETYNYTKVGNKYTIKFNLPSGSDYTTVSP